MLWRYITILCHRATGSPGPKNSQCQIKNYHLFHCPNSRLKENHNYCQKSVYQCSHNDTIPWAAEHFRECLEGERTEDVPRVSPQLKAHSEHYLGHHPRSCCGRPCRERAAASLPHPGGQRQHRPLTCQLWLCFSSKMSVYVHTSTQKT